MATSTERSGSGSRRVRLADIASRAKLSVSAVSMALADHPDINGTTKKRVRRISRQMGYAGPHAARNREQAEAAADADVALLIIGARLDDPAYAAMVHELTVDTQQAGMRLQIGAAVSEDAQRSAAQMAEANEALILVGLVEPGLLDRLVERGVTCIVIGYVLSNGHLLPNENATIVAPDDQEMGRLATSYLIGQGHTRIGFICETLPQGLSHSRWVTGYRLAHLDAGLPIDNDLIHVAGQVAIGGGPAAHDFARLSKPPTAVVAPDAPIVASFFRLASAKLKIERSAVVVGADPQRSTAFGLPDVPMVYCDPARLGKVAFHALQHALRGETTPGTSVILQPQTANLM